MSELAKKAIRQYRDREANKERERRLEYQRERANEEKHMGALRYNFEIWLGESALKRLDGVEDIRIVNYVLSNGYPFTPSKQPATEYNFRGIYAIVVLDNQIQLALDTYGALHPLVKHTGPDTYGISYYVDDHNVITSWADIGRYLDRPGLTRDAMYVGNEPLDDDE